MKVVRFVRWCLAALVCAAAVLVALAFCALNSALP